ncbi:MAG: GNAT family N-acetyltransferase [Bacteroidota bacterium]
MDLHSARLVFSPFTESDFSKYLKLVTDPRVMEMITGRALSELEAMDRFIGNLLCNMEHPDIGWYSVHTNDDRTFIGLAKIVMTAKHEAEIGYSLLTEHWGKGYGSEISETMVLHAKTIRSIHSLIAIIDPANKVSKRILEKGNFLLDKVCELNGLPGEIYRLNFKFLTA